MFLTYRISYLMLIFLTFVMLSGSIYGINIKYLVTMICLFSYLLILIRKHELNFFNLTLLLFFQIVLTFSLLIGIVKGYPFQYGISEYLGIISPIIIIALYNRKIIPINMLMKTMLVSAFTFSLLKILITYLISAHILSFDNVYLASKTIFNYEFVSMLISSDPYIVRIYVINDLLIAVIPIILFHSNLKLMNKTKYCLLFIFSISMLISYSRFLIAIFIIISLFEIFRANNLSIKASLKTLLNIGIVLSLFLFLEIPNFITDRFSTKAEGNISSDKIRDLQFDAIVEMIKNNVFVGTGLGGYNSSFIRHEYVYELQWMSMIFKFGIPLFVLVVVIMSLYFIKNMKFNMISTLYLTLIFSTSVFNPYLQSSVMGICILIVLYTQNSSFFTTNKK